MKLKKGDKVKVMVGKDRGKEGSVEKVVVTLGKVFVTGINVYKKHLKKRAEGQKVGIVEVVKPIDVSKLALICQKCKQITRIGYKIGTKGKERICRKCKQVI